MAVRLLGSKAARLYGLKAPGLKAPRLLDSLALRLQGSWAPLLEHSTQTCPLLLCARLHQFVKIVIYMTVELSKRIPLAVNSLIRYKCFAVKKLLFGYAYFYIVCIVGYTLHSHGLLYSTKRNETKRNRAKPNETKTILQLNLLRSIEIPNSLFLMVRTDVNN